MGFAPLYPRRMRVNQAGPGKEYHRKETEDLPEIQLLPVSRAPTTLSARLFCRYVQTSPLFFSFFVFNLLLHFFLFFPSLGWNRLMPVTGDESRGVTVS